MHLFSFTKKIVVLTIALSVALQLFVIPTHNAHAQSGALIGVSYDLFECSIGNELEERFNKALGDLQDRAKDKLGDILGDFNPLGGDDEGDSGDEGIPGSNNVPTDVLNSQPDEEREEKDCLSAAVKREFIKALVKDVLEFARSDDRTRFIQDYGEEIKKAADGATGELAREIIGSNICRPFRPHFEVIVERSLYPESGLRAPRFSCSISEAIDAQEVAIERFKNDFRNGGWERWIRLQRSTSNELGFWLAVNDQAIIERSRAEEAKKLEVQTGGGLLNEKECTVALFEHHSGFQETIGLNPAIKMSNFDTYVNEETTKDSGIAHVSCVNKKVITPASVISSQVNKAVSAETDNLIASDSFFEIIKQVMSIAVSDILRNGL